MKLHLINKRHKYIILIITLLFVSIAFLVDGAVVAKDTQGYLDMSINREAGYALFLNFFKTIFGESYQIFAVIFQMLLLAVSIYALTFTVVSIWNLAPFSAYVIWTIQICFLLLCRFGSGMQAFYASTLLTEGVTYPLYALFIKAVLQLNQKITAKRLTECIIYCTLLTFVRTQLMVTFFALIAFFILKKIFRLTSIKELAGVLIGCLAGIFLVMGGERIYIRTLYGVDGGTVGGNSFLLTAGLYGADAEDVALFEEEEEQYIFSELYKIADERKANKKYEPANGFLHKAEYYTQNFDVIKFEVTSPGLYQYFMDQGITDSVTIELEIDKIGKKIGIPLFMDNVEVKIRIFLEECVRGYMRTIAKGSVYLLPFVIIAYGGYLLLMFRSLKSKKISDAGWAGLFVLIIMTGNIFITAFMIFCEPRYVLYNMAPFYVMGYAMLAQVYRQKKEIQNRDSSIMSNNME